jgi:Ca2+-binding EF-hand superfamily protein
MGEKALQFGSLADLELLNQLLGECSELLSGLKGELSGAKVDIEARAARNKELPNRMLAQKKKMNKDMGALISKMMSAMGQDPSELLTEQQINRILSETFKKFDTDNTGLLERPEFHEAWAFLGLDGEREEVDGAFDSVDSDKSGKIDEKEFTWAVSSNRMADLSMSVILTQMDGKLDGLEDIFTEYKANLAKAQQEAQERLQNSQDDYMNFQATVRRRRMLKKQMQEQIANQVRIIVRKLRVLNGDLLEEEEAEDYKFYQTLKDTFNAFDKDGNAELQYPEYSEAWKFLNLQGGEKAIKSAFDSVDVDSSGLVEWSEFVFSIMGDKALKYGVLADLEALAR